MGKRTQTRTRECFIPKIQLDACEDGNEKSRLSMSRLGEAGFDMHRINYRKSADSLIQYVEGKGEGFYLTQEYDHELPDMKKRRALIKKVKRLGFLPGGVR